MLPQEGKNGAFADPVARSKLGRGHAGLVVLNQRLNGSGIQSPFDCVYSERDSWLLILTSMCNMSILGHVVLG